MRGRASAFKKKILGSVNSAPTPIKPLALYTDQEFLNTLQEAGYLFCENFLKLSDGTEYLIRVYPTDTQKISSFVTYFPGPSSNILSTLRTSIEFSVVYSAKLAVINQSSDRAFTGIAEIDNPNSLTLLSHHKELVIWFKGYQLSQGNAQQELAAKKPLTQKEIDEIAAQFGEKPTLKKSKTLIDDAKRVLPQKINSFKNILLLFNKECDEVLKNIQQFSKNLRSRAIKPSEPAITKQTQKELNVLDVAIKELQEKIDGITTKALELKVETCEAASHYNKIITARKEIDSIISQRQAETEKAKKELKKLEEMKFKEKIKLKENAQFKQSVQCFQEIAGRSASDTNFNYSNTQFSRYRDGSVQHLSQFSLFCLPKLLRGGYSESCVTYDNLNIRTFVARKS